MPFVVTPDNVTLAMLELAQVGPQDFVLDLGSGDGRIVILAARRFGARGLGVEIVPELVERSRRNAAKAGVAERASFVEQDLFKTDLSAATVITMYLLQEVNLQLRPALLALQPGTRIVSHDWDMGDWRPDRSVTVDAPDKPVGLRQAQPAAPVGGAGAGRRRLVWQRGEPTGARLRLAQHYQVFDATPVGGQHGAAAGRAHRRAAPAQRGRLRGHRRRRAPAHHASGDAPASAGWRRVRTLRRLAPVRRRPSNCSWRSAAADKSAAKPGSLSR